MSEDRLADSINSEPIVLKDCTGSEIIMASIVAFVIGLVLGIFIGILMGRLMIGLILGLLLSIGITYGLLEYLCRVRSKYYETWLKEKWFMLKLRSGFFDMRFIEDSCRYSRGARKHG
jgi:conjugative transfer region protein (TIGR03750 family)